MTETDGAAQSTDQLVEVAHRTGHYIAGHFQNVIAFYWMSVGSLQAVAVLNQLCDEASVGQTQHFSAIHIVRANIGLPDAEVRQALVASMKKYADPLCCLAVVTLGAGFWVSALQSVITGIRMLAPVGGSTLRFVQRPENLKGWFVSEHAARSGRKLDELRLLESIQQLLRRGDRAQPAAPTG